ncbi:MAG: GNAT family N-acetyltransferase [Candidatus Nanoarchaeia archaeon]|nr:GNAT family N-acetyltransferase [Candidatus Nanoarchaeia archaeon]MDD5239794.1 GNAT family N-acetyltransferase [Candidatus Nanoarchaeia archaeon]
MKILIRKPALADFPEVFALLKQLWLHKRFNKNLMKKTFAKALKNKSQDCIIAVYNGRTIGFASATIKNSFWDTGNSCYIDTLVVDKMYRGYGIGKKLLKEIINLAKKKACKRIECDSDFRRKEAHKFYESHGFEKCNFMFSKDI